MKKFYMSGKFYNTDNDYEESFEKIIDAESEYDAETILKKAYIDEFNKIDIEQCYETSDDARI